MIHNIFALIIAIVLCFGTGASKAQGFMNTANTITDIAVGFTNVGSAYEAIVGKTITGQELTPFQRGVAGVSVAFAPLAFVARIGGNAVEGAAAARGLAKQADDAPTGIVVRNAGEVQNVKNRNLVHSPIGENTALSAGEKWLGPGYSELGAMNSGVFRSKDGLRQFRMTDADLNPLDPHVIRGGIGPHVHFEAFDQFGKKIENLHVPLMIHPLK